MPQPTTAQSLGSLLKSARDIMRKDKGLNGDLDRLPMLTWIMFLKFLDDLELQRAEEAKLAGKKLKAAIEAPYRWRDWAANPQGVTGDELLAFINNEEAVLPNGERGQGLFRYLRKLTSSNGDNRRDVIATVFRGVQNRMVSGYLLRDVINKLNGIHFTANDELHTLGALYESMLREMRDAAGDSGEFYTPRAVVRFMVAVTDPRLGEVVLDPASGTGGFLVEAFDHLRKQVKTVADRKVLQEKSLIGCEPKSLPYLLCQMNLLLHGLDAPQIDPGNALRHKLTDIGERDRVDVILTNPPFGGEEEKGIQGNFPEDKQTSETALLFLQLLMRKLRRHGGKSRAAVVVPDGTLSGSGVAVAIRLELLRDFKLHAVVQLPPGAFAPYAETARTNILFFDTSGPTSDIWYYQVPPPNGRKQCSKNNPLTEADFEPVRACWLGRKKSLQAWFVKRAEIDAESCDLLRRNPSVVNPGAGLNVAEVVHRATEIVRSTLADLRELEQKVSLQNPERRHLGGLLQRSQRIILVDDATEYKQLTIQYHYRGVRLRGALKGAAIGTKRQFAVRAGQVVLSRIDARYGAIGFVPAELDDAIITGDFRAFDVNRDEVLPEYLDLFFGLPEFAKLCERASKGTTRRQRLDFDLFASISVPWLPIPQQSQMVSRIKAASSIGQRLGTLADEIRGLPMELVRQTFGFNWVEENAERMHATTEETSED